MVFKGFINVKYPEYEVITPQTKLSFNVRSLNVREEERMKGSLMTPTKITEHLNKCIFESITTKPDSVTNLEEFLRTVTLKDRDALLYGLYHITYGEVRNYEVRCSSCRNEYPITVEISSTFNFTAYPGDNVLDQRARVELPVTKGVTAIIKQPSLFDEAAALRELSVRPGSNIDLIIETLILDSFEEDIPERTEPKKYTDKADIIDAYLTLAAKDKRAIHKAYLEEFGKYGIELKMKSYCTSCGEESDIDIDLVENFFRECYSA